MDIKQQNFLIYGSYGYTGQLIAKFSVEQGLQPILAGRNEEKIKAQAKQLGLKGLVLDLKDQKGLDRSLEQVRVVIHCAGPFEHTAQRMVEACLRTKTHYIDITGEATVFEQLQNYNEQALEAEIMLMPGAGFDVVPSDCLAKHLHNRLPDATDLQLAFTMEGGRSSHGTSNTIVENLKRNGMIRKNGKLIEIPTASQTRWIDFELGKRHCVCIPWGDISTAFVSTQIPNIKVFMGMPPKAIKWMRFGGKIRWLLGTRPLQGLLKWMVKRQPAGPTDEQRAKAKSYLWGEVTNEKGAKLSSQLLAPEGYTLTALTALLITRKILKGEYTSGFQTPSKAYGADLILEIEGTKRIDK